MISSLSHDLIPEDHFSALENVTTEIMSSQPQGKSERKASEKKGKPKGGGTKSNTKSNNTKSNTKRNYQKAANKNKPTRDVDVKKVYKIAFRELPSNNFNEANFKECLNSFLEGMCIEFSNHQQVIAIDRDVDLIYDMLSLRTFIACELLNLGENAQTVCA